MLGVYEILELVGVGGMGAVYRARHARVQKRVALKILKPDLALASPDLVRLFFEEAVKAGRLEHPNIIKVTDAGMSEDDIAFLVMEWLDGRTLDSELEEKGPLKVERVAVLLEEICEAAGYAHRQGIVHRDLKPSNIMLCADHRGRETVKILDFGIAKALDSTLGLNSQVLGAPYYASPEQLTLSAPIDKRSDVYSLGVTAYQLLTGELPFNADSIEKVIRQHLTVSPPLMRAQRSELSQEVEEVVQRALAKRADERYQSANELARAFREAANVEPGSLEMTCTDERGLPLSGAAVYLDGEYAGRTDERGRLRRDDLSPREYGVDVTCLGYAAVRKEVVVEPRREAKLLLWLGESASGELSIRVGVAGAQVLLNGSPAGTTDGAGTLHLRGIEPGEVEVEIRRRKYQPSVRKVRVVRGQTTGVELTLTPAPRFGSLRGWALALARPHPVALAAVALVLFAAATVLLWQSVISSAAWLRNPRPAPSPLHALPTATPAPTPDAAKEAELARVREKGRAAAFSRRGDELYELEPKPDYAGAEAAYEQAMTLDPGNADYHFKLGAARLRLQKYAMSEKEFREAVRLDGGNHRYHLNLGLAIWNLKDPSRLEEVVSEYKTAVRLAEGQGAPQSKLNDYRSNYLNVALAARRKSDAPGEPKDTTEGEARTPPRPDARNGGREGVAYPAPTPRYKPTPRPVAVNNNTTGRGTRKFDEMVYPDENGPPRRRNKKGRDYEH